MNQMEYFKVFEFEGLLTDSGWLAPAFVGVDDKGHFKKMSSSKLSGSVEKVPGFGIPGFQNAHSHGFQYLLGGLVENIPCGKAQDDFWSWRKTMYEWAKKLTPDSLEAVASQLYGEMLVQGYTHVCEFQYLHHDQSGKPYSRLSAMSEALVRGAYRVGMGITIVPVYYNQGGFGKSPEDGQKRFIFDSRESYFRLIDDVKEMVNSYEGSHWAVGVHSLRASLPEDIVAIFEQYKGLCPKHIHIAEQVAEVEQSIHHLGARPVEWLLDKVDLGKDFHLVHATHMTEDETHHLAKSEAHVVICPSTEGNLGDGVFPLVNYLEHGGRWSIGSDSHVGLSPMEELRWLDYIQRLNQRQRNIFCKSGEDSGQRLFDGGLWGGRAAGGLIQDSYFAMDESFDIVVIDSNHPRMAHGEIERILSTLIFAGDSRCLLGTITSGKWRVQSQKLVNGIEVFSEYKKLFNV